MIKSIRHGLGVDISYNENVCVIAYNSNTITINNTKEHMIELSINVTCSELVLSCDHANGLW